MSFLTDIADAVADELNSRTWSLRFEAKKQNVPRHRRDEMKDLHVTVSPKSRTSSPSTRGQTYQNIEIYIGIEKGLNGDRDEESNPLIDLGEEIATYFENGRSLASYPNAPCVSSTFGSGDGSPWMNVQVDSEALLYRGVVVVEFQALRTVS